MIRRKLLASVVIHSAPVPFYEPEHLDIFYDPFKPMTRGLLNTPNVWANKTPVEILAEISGVLEECWPRKEQKHG